jgi:hypothetical protein
MVEFETNCENEEKFCQDIVTDYFIYGSVEELFKAHDYNLPISVMGVHRILNKWGIIKNAGPNRRLSEITALLNSLTEKHKTVFLLRKSLPIDLKSSIKTLYRIIHNIKSDVIRRKGTALVITQTNKPDQILVGENVTSPRIEYGKMIGSITLPMGYSRHNENTRDSILRILQQEVLTDLAIKRSLPLYLIPQKIQPFMYIDIADVRVAVYQIMLLKELREVKFSSFKIDKFRWVSLKELVNPNEKKNFRMGVIDIARGYQKYLENYVSGKTIHPIFEKSYLNKKLALAYADK